MKTSAKKYCISVFSLLAAIILLFSVTACTVRGQKDDAPADGSDPAFSGNNSDYTESVGYEEGSVEGADLAAAYEQTYRSVVTVSVPETGGASRSGTGFIVDSDSGLVVTSSSLFMNESGRLAAEECSVGLYDGTVLSVSDKNENNIEGRNIEIVGVGFNVPQVGDKFTVTEQYRSAYAALQTFIGKINDRGMRGNILRITYWQQEGYDPADWQSIAYFIVETTEGVQMQIFDPVRNAAEKADLVLDIYENPYVMSAGEGGEKVYLGDEGRMYGCILAYDYYDRFEGNFTDIIVSYDPEGAPTIVDTAEG